MKVLWLSLGIHGEMAQRIKPQHQTLRGSRPPRPQGSEGPTEYAQVGKKPLTARSLHQNAQIASAQSLALREDSKRALTYSNGLHLTQGLQGGHSPEGMKPPEAFQKGVKSLQVWFDFLHRHVFQQLQHAVPLLLKLLVGHQGSRFNQRVEGVNISSEPAVQ